MGHSDISAFCAIAAAATTAACSLHGEVVCPDKDGNGERRFCFAYTERIGTLTRYDALMPYDAASGFTSKALEDGVRFNLIVNDSDSDRRESAIGIATEAFLSDDMATAPTVRFAK